jgi:hypothetical protein
MEGNEWILPTVQDQAGVKIRDISGNEQKGTQQVRKVASLQTGMRRELKAWKAPRYFQHSLVGEKGWILVKTLGKVKKGMSPK